MKSYNLREFGRVYNRLLRQGEDFEVVSRGKRVCLVTFGFENVQTIGDPEVECTDNEVNVRTKTIEDEVNVQTFDPECTDIEEKVDIPGAELPFETPEVRYFWNEITGDMEPLTRIEFFRNGGKQVQWDKARGKL